MEQQSWMQFSGIGTVKGGKKDSDDDLVIEDDEEQHENEAVKEVAVSEEAADDGPEYFFVVFFKDEVGTNPCNIVKFERVDQIKAGKKIKVWRESHQ